MIIEEETKWSYIIYIWLFLQAGMIINSFVFNFIVTLFRVMNISILTFS